MKKKEIKDFLKSIENKSFERRLFEMLQKIGEVLDGDLHVIQTNAPHIRDEGESYRVYISSGYCFDVTKNLEYEDGEEENPTLDFQYYAEWEGFDGLRVNDACLIIEKYLLSK